VSIQELHGRIRQTRHILAGTDAEHYPLEHATLVRLLDDLEAQRDALLTRPAHAPARPRRDRPVPHVDVADIARRRGLHVEMSPSGAVRISGPGVNLVASNIQMVSPTDLDPNNRNPRAPRY
jgi:hypothetical protein